MTNKVEIFSKLLRDLEAEIGTRDLADLSLKAFVDAIGVLKLKNASEFCRQFEELAKIVSNTEPKFGILIYHFKNLIREFKRTISQNDLSEKEWKQFALKAVNDILIESRLKRNEIFHAAEKINVENKVILIHDHSHTVQDVLAHYKRIGKHFRVVIAEQDFEKTHSNIERLHALEIPFQVVPAYMLSHVHHQIDMLFFGALTLKDSMDFVMDPGTHGIISEFHVERTPAFMFIDTTKFSLWKSKKRGEIFIHEDTRIHHTKAIEYKRIKYSHDRVPAELFHRIVTNEGVFTPHELKELFDKKMEEYDKVCA